MPDPFLPDVVVADTLSLHLSFHEWHICTLHTVRSWDYFCHTLDDFTVLHPFLERCCIQLYISIPTRCGSVWCTLTVFNLALCLEE